MFVMPLCSEWPHHVKWGTKLGSDTSRLVTWLNQHVGQQGQYWDISIGYWLFARESDAMAFVINWC